MIIKSCLKNYEVNISETFDLVEKIQIDDKTFVVVDKILYDLYPDVFKKFDTNNLYIVTSIETNKTIETALDICEKMTELSAKRNTKLISFGGGIVQDITGFVANILYRGISWTFFPTTLLAACDSCIGGKTSLNYKSYKNLLGTFFPPDRINICAPFFNTLSEKDFLSGLGEVVKFNFMFGEDGIQNMYENIDQLLMRNHEVVLRFVNSSLEFKKKYIEQDEFDKGCRIQLNFAHTFGHAFETVSKYEIPHGTAVAMGTIVANNISLKRGILSSENTVKMEGILKQIIKVNKNCLNKPMSEFLAAIKKDKKQIDSSITAVLMDDDFNLNIVHDVLSEEIEMAISYLLNEVIE